MSKTPEERLRFCEEIRARVERMCSRLNATPIPPDPFLRGPKETDASIRRTITRLRAGVIRPSDPAIDPIELAGLLESRLEYRKAVAEFGQELGRIHELVSAEKEGEKADLMAGAIATLHTAKQLPAAKDPNSNLSQHIRNMDRARRHDLGRPRKRKRR
jgi:hypothetical protein